MQGGLSPPERKVFIGRTSFSHNAILMVADPYFPTPISPISYYRKISIDGLELKVSGVDPYEQVELRMVPDKEAGLIEIRFWHGGKFIGIQRVKGTDLKKMNF